MRGLSGEARGHWQLIPGMPGGCWQDHIRQPPGSVVVAQGTSGLGHHGVQFGLGQQGPHNGAQCFGIRCVQQRWVETVQAELVDSARGSLVHSSGRTGLPVTM
ncbi:hypothetical protein ACWC5I_14425 [Kitasatospora sp. NPDC001574]